MVVGSTDGDGGAPIEPSGFMVAALAPKSAVESWLTNVADWLLESTEGVPVEESSTEVKCPETKVPLAWSVTCKIADSVRSPTEAKF